MLLVALKMALQKIVSPAMLIITCIFFTHTDNSNIKVINALDKQTLLSSQRKSLNESVCNLNQCQFSSKEKFHFCSCDKECFEKGECCLGIFSEEEEANIKEQDMYEVYQHEDFFGGEFIKVVGRCPSNATNDMEIQQCHNSVANTSDPVMMFPMTSRDTDIVYKNLACARCNEGNETQFQIKFILFSENQRPRTLEEGFSLYVYNRSILPTLPSNADIIKYEFYLNNDVFIHCPSSNDSLNKWRCSTYLAPFTYKDRRYKNIFCAECNGIQVKQEDVVCREFMYSGIDQYSFQIDANFSIGGKSPFPDNQTRCKAGSVYDPYQQQCRRLFFNSSAMSEDEKAINSTVTDHLSITNVSKAISTPKCILHTYNKTEYKEMDSAKFPRRKEIIIKTTNETYLEGEYQISSLYGNLSVCEKQTDSNLPLCVSNHCPSNSSSTVVNCSCSFDCFKKYECCIDAFIQEQFPSINESDFLNCIPLSSGSRVLAVSQCPKDYGNYHVLRNCESFSINDPFLKIPVYSSLTNVTYRNIYCGICHDAKDLFFVPFEISCNDKWNSRTLMTALKWTKGDNAKCNLIYKVESTPFSYCSIPMGYKCPDEWTLSTDMRKKEINLLCRLINAPITVKTDISKIIYGNIYCAQCNGVDLDSPNIKVQCLLESEEVLQVSTPIRPPAPPPRPRHLGVLFTVG